MTREQYDSVKPNNLSAFHVVNGITASKGPLMIFLQPIVDKARSDFLASLRPWVQDNQRRSTDIRHRNYGENKQVEQDAVMDLLHEYCTERPKTTRRIEDETPLATRARDRMRRAATPSTVRRWEQARHSFVSFWSPCFVVAGLLGVIKGLAERMTRWIKRLFCPFTVSLAPPTRRHRSLCSEQCAHRIASSKERARSSKQAALLVFREVATMIEIYFPGIILSTVDWCISRYFLASYDDQIGLVTSLAVHRIQANFFYSQSLDATSSQDSIGAGSLTITNVSADWVGQWTMHMPDDVMNQDSNQTLALNSVMGWSLLLTGFQSTSSKALRRLPLWFAGYFHDVG
ncbi:hypothetical protein C8J56DRAFT_897799 [Mycena floridula]|nr:hypothetical protein C8J56DRAFT_897799 [Mycena floridula]